MTLLTISARGRKSMTDMSADAADTLLNMDYGCSQCGMSFVRGKPYGRKTERLICSECGVHYWCSMPVELKNAHKCRCGIDKGEVKRW